MGQMSFKVDGRHIVLVEDRVAPFALAQIEIGDINLGENGSPSEGSPLSGMGQDDFAKAVARCLNAALKLDAQDFGTAAQALEIAVDRMEMEIRGTDTPVQPMEEAIRYVFDQERWRFVLKRERRDDGFKIVVDNPNGAPVPLAIHVSTRGKTPSFWVMQHNRLLQNSHAYKIPIQAATALKSAVQDYMDVHDIGTIRPFG